MNASKEEYQRLLLQDYPEAFEPNGCASGTMERSAGLPKRQTGTQTVKEYFST